MSLNRYAPKRDANEPDIRKRFAHHGWHTEALSGTGMPDLLVWPQHPGLSMSSIARCGQVASALVDVKMPSGKVTPQQIEKWSSLNSKGITVYVVRSGADVDALVVGTLEAWSPHHSCTLNGCESGELCGTSARRPSLRHPYTVKGKRKPDSNYTPPRGERVDAAKVVEEAFAPSFQCPHGPACVHGCTP